MSHIYQKYKGQNNYFFGPIFKDLNNYYYYFLYLSCNILKDVL